MTTRRQFLSTAAAVSGGALIAHRALEGLAWGAPPAPMNILILGGTGYIGPHLVRLAVSRGHKVTTFTRGRRKPELPPEVVQLIGDRNGQLQALEGKTWDAVIDDSATNPEYVRMSTDLLKGKAAQYLFTSSTGVYYPYLKRGLDETTMPHTTMADPKDGSESFGVQKAQCEEIARAAFGEGAIVVRPTYIVGPGDTSDRFPYWPQRLARGGETLAPGKKSDPVQVVDVRDLVAFYLKLLEEKRGGTYNASGPRDPLTMESFLDQAMKALGSTSRLVWIDDYEFLKAHQIPESVPFIMLEGNDLGHTTIKNGKAVAAGLAFRPLAETVKDTLGWWATVPEERRAKPRFTITPEIEAKALLDWKARK